jgi:hypothetical protein
MSPVEVTYRVRDEMRRRNWARRQVRPGDAPPLPAGVLRVRTFDSALPPNARADVPAAAVAAVVAAADRVLDGTWTVLGVRRPDSADPDWFLDPLTGRRAPSDQLAFRVHYRD